MVSSYTVVLVNGAHIIDAQSASSIQRAIDEDRRTVEVNIDILGVGESSKAILAVRHIIALLPNEDEEIDLAFKATRRLVPVQ